MEMERIDEDTIRVIISSEDLEERGITFADLIKNHKEIETFFYSILDEVDEDHQFANNDAVTFQVVPNTDGFDLYISKNPAKSIDKIMRSVSQNKKNLISDEKELDNVTNFIKDKLMGDQKGTDDDFITVDNKPNGKIRKNQIKFVVKMKDFESLPNLVELLKVNDNRIQTSLYKYNNDYYLSLDFRSMENTPDTIKNDMAIVYEFGDATKISKDLLQEHGKTIISNNALNVVHEYFD